MEWTGSSPEEQWKKGPGSRRVGRGDIGRFAKRNKLSLFLLLLFFLGMVYGAIVVSAGSTELIDTLSFMTSGFIEKRAEQSLLTTFLGSVSSNGMLLIVLFFLGFGAIFQPAEGFIPIFRGLGLGLSMGYLYSYYGLKGVGFCCLLILPHAFISTLTLILAARESIKLSNLFFGCIRRRPEEAIGAKAIKLYTMKYLIFLVFVLAAAIVDCLMTFLFARFFIL